VGFRKTDLNFLCILFLFLKYADEQLWRRLEEE
jgi:hypothetical protein